MNDNIINMNDYTNFPPEAQEIIRFGQSVYGAVRCLFEGNKPNFCPTTE